MIHQIKKITYGQSASQIEKEKNQEIILKPGDMLIYRGCELYHWRDKFLGLCHAQVFLHYKDINGPFYDKDKMYDDRFSLGLPRKYQLFTK